MLEAAIFSCLIAMGSFVYFCVGATLVERLVAAAICGGAVMFALASGIAWYDEKELLDIFTTEELFGTVLGGGSIGLVVGGIIAGIQVAWRRAPTMVSEVSAAARNRAIESANLEDAVYSDISDELESGNIDRAVWIKAYEKSNGDRQRAKAEYIRLRKKKLLNQ